MRSLALPFFVGGVTSVTKSTSSEELLSLSEDDMLEESEPEELSAQALLR